MMCLDSAKMWLSCQPKNWIQFFYQIQSCTYILNQNALITLWSIHFSVKCLNIPFLKFTSLPVFCLPACPAMRPNFTTNVALDFSHN